MNRTKIMVPCAAGFRVVALSIAVISSVAGACLSGKSAGGLSQPSRANDHRLWCRHHRRCEHADLGRKAEQQARQEFRGREPPGRGRCRSRQGCRDARFPDGYTLFLVGNSYAISTALFKSLPYDVLKDFVPISAVATFDFLVATKKDSKFKSMQDVIAYAKANPGKLNIATLSPGTTQYLAVELLKVAAGVDVTAVTFRSSPDAASALLRGDVDLDMDSYAPLKPLLEGGKIDVIATTGRDRVPFLSGVPTVIESGLPNFDVTSWNGLAAPAGVPAPIIAKLNKAVNRGPSDARSAGDRSKAGHADARQHAGRTAGAIKGRHCQMVRPHRESAHPEARIRRHTDNREAFCV